MKGISLSKKGKREKSICNAFPFLCIFLRAQYRPTVVSAKNIPRKTLGKMTKKPIITVMPMKTNQGQG